MKALVTGATGCLGRNLINRLLNEGWLVTAVGRNVEIGDLLNKRGAIFRKINLEDKHKLIDACKNQDVVFHCGALSAPWGKYEDFYKSNVIGTKNIVEACLKNNIKRLVYVSTPSIYFDFTEKYDIKEDSALPNLPVNFYVKTKLQAEKIIDKAFKEKNLPVITIRPRAIFGPHDNAIMPRIINAAQKGKLPLINGGNILVDVTYVENVVESMMLCLQAKQTCFGKVYNITNDEPILLKDMLGKAFEKLNIQFKPKKIPYKFAYNIASLMEKIHSWPFIKTEPVLTKYSVGVFSFGQTLNIDLAKKDLGYKPIVSIEDGINLFAKWWERENESGI